MLWSWSTDSLHLDSSAETDKSDEIDGMLKLMNLQRLGGDGEVEGCA